jgi:hypothetical protein
MNRHHPEDLDAHIFQAREMFHKSLYAALNAILPQVYLVKVRGCQKNRLFKRVSIQKFLLNDDAGYTKHLFINGNIVPLR